MSNIAVIDFGSGNLRSVGKAIEHVAGDSRVAVTDDPNRIHAADHVVFPGQGAIGACMRTMDSKGLRDAVREALDSKPFLGICLGLQALYESSEEDGGTAGLGFLHGRVAHFRHLNGGASWDRGSGPRLKIPHMGWNQVEQTQRHPLWHGIAPRSRFYFVHSYCATSDDRTEIYGETDYGGRFVACGGRENVFAVQFHPEKSQHAGLALLRNFVAWDGAGG